MLLQHKIFLFRKNKSQVSLSRGITSEKYLLHPENAGGTLGAGEEGRSHPYAGFNSILQNFNGGLSVLGLDCLYNYLPQFYDLACII